MATAHDDGALFPCSVCKQRLASLFYTGFLFHYFFSSQARFWVQVMRDLREGVKLKKVQERQYNPLPIEYQLTPYEMLMDDIRSKRYKLRKVMVSVKTRVAALKILLECCTQCCTVVAGKRLLHENHKVALIIIGYCITVPFTNVMK